MKYKIAADSSCNIVSGEDSTFASVPMKIVAEREYVDDAHLDVAQMVEDLKQYKGKSGSSCPNVGEWLEAFGDAEEVFGITISKHLSGSYNAARHAADTYMAEHPERKVFIFDSLATGPEMMMLAQKIRQCEDAGDDFETTKEKVLGAIISDGLTFLKITTKKNLLVFKKQLKKFNLIQKYLLLSVSVVHISVHVQQLTF